MNWFRRIMIGRYGIDPLGIALLVSSLVILLIRGMLHQGSFFGMLLSLAALLLLAACYLRVFSRNYERRRMENERFMTWWRPASRWLLGRKAAFEEMQQYKHLKCPKCGQKIRIPRGRGKVAINCPACREKFIRKV